jgi:hypothetical protein
MKRFGWFLLLVAAVPALLPAQTRKMTVAQLQDVLTGLHSSRKSDEQIATQLKQIELTEELTGSAMNRMANLVNGQLSTEQMYVLEARSCILAPPDTDLPKAAPPGTVAQRAMLAKAQDYAAKTYPQLPRFTATRLVARFQDGVATMQSYGGNKIRIGDGSDPLWEHNNPYARLVNTHVDAVEIDKGIERPGSKDTTPWGRNGLVNSMLSFLPLELLTSEAVSSGKPKFLRWETINGHRTAVFAFAVDKKKSLYAIDYCCFPETSSFNSARFENKGVGGFTGLSSGNLNSGPAASPSGYGNVSYVADWNPFKAKSGYHGELFFDPDSGVVVRTILEVKFKSSALVHYEDIRVDYAPISIGGNKLYVPAGSFTIAEIVPNGDSVVSRYGIRHQYVIQNNKDFQTMDGTYQLAALLIPGETSAGLQGGKTAESDTSHPRSGEEDDDPPPGGFPALETISRPDGPLAIAASAHAIQRPPEDEITALLAKAAQSANVYWDSLPNFTCEQVTERFAGSSRANKWEPIDTLTGRLNYFDHQEDWQFQEYEKNHKKSFDSGSNPGRGLSGFGIFGNNIRGLFRPSAKPEISWFENDMLGDRTVQIFKYRVAKENSNLSLRVSSMEVIYVGYHGMVYIDGATGEVRRITQVADDVPKHYPIYQTLISADYDHVSIGGQQYLLPIGAEIVLRRSHRGSLELNQIRFGDFHRFRSVSRILGNAPSSAQ